MLENIQPIEKRDHRNDGTLSVHSIFYTIQGEGPFAGTPAVFIRLAGCNLKCPACDTDYTSGRHRMTLSEIIRDVRLKMNAGLVVITGGEPFRQNIADLCIALTSARYYVQIESNGTLPPANLAYTLSTDSRSGVYLVCSPKTGKIDKMVPHYAVAFKYVVEAGNIHEDGLPLSALRHTANPYPARPPRGWGKLIYVQPLDAQNPEANRANYDAALQSCLKHGYILQLQIHKIVGVE